MGDRTEGMPPPAGNPEATGELRYAGMRLILRGRTLRLVLWLAAHQPRVNEITAEWGQLWLTWKGDGIASVDGEIKTKL